MRDEDEDEVESIGDGEDVAAALVALLGSILELLLGVFIDSTATAVASAVVPPAVLVLTEGEGEEDWAEPEKKLLALLMATYRHIRVGRDKIVRYRITNKSRRT